MDDMLDEECFDFSSMDPGDGFGARVRNFYNSRAEVLFSVQVGGEISREEIVFEDVSGEATGVGRAIRQQLLWNGFADFLNAGGTTEEVVEAAKLLQANFQGTQIVPEGWDYLNFGVDALGNSVHEFISKDSRRAVRWVVDSYVDADIPVTKMLEDLHDDSTESITDEFFGLGRASFSQSSFEGEDLPSNKGLLG